MAFGLGKMFGGGILAVGGGLTWVLSAEPRLSPFVALGGVGIWGIGIIQMKKARAALRSPNTPTKLATRAVASRVRAHLTQPIEGAMDHMVASQIVFEATVNGALAGAQTSDDFVREALQIAEDILINRPDVLARIIAENTSTPHDLSAIQDLPINKDSGVALLSAIEGATDLLEQDLKVAVSAIPSVLSGDVRLAAAHCVQQAWATSMTRGTSTFLLRVDGLALFESARVQYGSLEHAVAALAAARTMR